MRCILFHKPYNVLSQFSPERGTTHRTLREFIAIPGIYAAGRLDRDSEGLLLLTDDGQLQHRLTDPRYCHPRTYWAQVEGIATNDALARLQDGVHLKDGITLPAKACVIEHPNVPPRDPPIRVRQHIPTSWIELTLREGRNRQVRRMTAAVGLPTLRLLRVAIGSISLSGLAAGTWRFASIEEKTSLLESTTLGNSSPKSASYSASHGKNRE